MKQETSIAPDSAWRDEAERKVSRHFSATRVSFSYLAKDLQPGYLALYELLATIEECFVGASDSLVSKAKLVWWHEELAAARQGDGTHPLSKQLASSGALHAWPEPMVTRLFKMALDRVDPSGLSTEEELWGFCKDLGLVHLELECSLQQIPLPENPRVHGVAAVNGLLQLMRESFWAPYPNFYWVPLVVCARLNLARKDLALGQTAIANRQWIKATSNIILDCPETASAGKLVIGSAPPAWSQANQHWLIFSVLQQRQLSRINKASARSGRVEEIAGLLSRGTLLDGWAAWRLASSLKAGKRSRFDGRN